jgi:catechol-2,3-dioxygenase
MKAVVVHQYGGPEVLKFEEFPDPVAGAPRSGLFHNALLLSATSMAFAR